MDEAGRPADRASSLSGRPARNAAVLAAAEIVGKVGTLAYTVIAARALTTDAYGVFAYAVSVSLLLATLPTWGFDELVVQRSAADLRRLDGLVARALTGKLAVAVPLFAVAGALIAIDRPDVRTTLFLVLGAAFLDVLSDTGRAAATASQRLTGVSVALTVNRLLTAGLALVALSAGTALVGLATAYLVGSVLGLIVTVVAVRRIGIRFGPLGPVSGAWELARRSWAIGLASVLGVTLFKVDAVLIEVFHGDAAVGRYTVAYRLVETVMFLSWSVAEATFPTMSEDTSPPRLRRLAEEAIGAIGVLYLPFIAIAVLEGGPVLDLLFGAPYGTASRVSLAILAVTPFVYSVGYVGGYVLLAVERPGRRLASIAVVTALNIGANLVLIPRLAEAGAAWATTASYLAEGILVLAILRPLVGTIRPWADLTSPLAGTLALAAVLLALDLPVLAELAIGGAVFAVVWTAVASRWQPDQLALVRSLAPGR